MRVSQSNSTINKLSIVIPALNEEQAIQAILDRTLSIQDQILKETGLNEVEVIVVDDGSTDKTAELVRLYSKQGVKLVQHAKNRGYGAAIQTGFSSATGDFLSFLDADGTCDPLSFIDLLKKMMDSGSDIVIGSRLNPRSEMPPVRKLGNLFYRYVVNAISSESVTDIASGMRVIKRSSLQNLAPLPYGLNFTPAMSMRAIMDRDIRIDEVPISYNERIGRSKLSIFNDGFRFLKSILEIAFTYRPLRLFGFVGILFLCIAFAYGVGPVLHYAQYRSIPEYQIYRLVFIVAATVSGIQLLFIGLLSQGITNLAHGYEMQSAVERLLDYSILRRLTLLGVVLIAAALILNYKTISQYLSTGQVHQHWSYVVTGALLVLVGLQFLAFGVVNRIITILKEQIHSKNAE